eukprot:m.1386909 g.1386909  ORF g.1386909 m.1386909 type:complete len:108 (-) comp24978_c1_seq5:2585-2908(-)
MHADALACDWSHSIGKRDFVHCNKNPVFWFARKVAVASHHSVVLAHGIHQLNANSLPAVVLVQPEKSDVTYAIPVSECTGSTDSRKQSLTSWSPCAIVHAGRHDTMH